MTDDPRSRRDKWAQFSHREKASVLARLTQTSAHQWSDLCTADLDAELKRLERTRSR